MRVIILAQWVAWRIIGENLCEVANSRLPGSYNCLGNCSYSCFINIDDMSVNFLRMVLQEYLLPSQGVWTALRLLICIIKLYSRKKHG